MDRSLLYTTPAGAFRLMKFSFTADAMVLVVYPPLPGQRTTYHRSGWLERHYDGLPGVAQSYQRQPLERFAGTETFAAL
jgi:hypothetical protein